MRQMITMEIDSPARRVEPERLSSRLVCIGQNVTLSDDGYALPIQRILISPAGQVTFFLNTPATQRDLDLLASLRYEA